MKLIYFKAFSGIFGLLALLFHDAKAFSSVEIKTDIGIVEGFRESTSPTVVQFLGIPYAEPPVGQRRWQPAVPKKDLGSLRASAFGPSCPQADVASQAQGPWALEFLIKPNSTDEDCLYLNVWTPFDRHKPGKDLLPVLVWIHGGGLTSGGGNIDYQIPIPWIERSQKHIVVGINYRLGVFGFPNAPGLNLGEQNLGLLDQRLAIEWVRDNIAHFGGDPARIVIWGQSAGAASVGYYQFAYPEDPIAIGAIQDSGTVYIPMGSSDVTQSNFTSLARAFDCEGPNAIDCLRSVYYQGIQDYVDNNSNLSFNVIVDGRTKFSDYPERVMTGKIARLPTIIGTNRDEYTFLEAPQPGNSTRTHVVADSLFGCPAHFDTAVRTAAGLKTWRYVYSGNFTNIMPGGEGAYHSAELPLVMGTHNIARGKSTPFEAALSHSMQDFWLAFISDPTNGLNSHGWHATQAGGLTTVQTGVDLGFGDRIIVEDFSWAAWQQECSNATAI